MRVTLCIFLLFLSIIASAQKRYKFTYDIHLKNIPSTYTITYDSSSYTKIICVDQQNDTLLQSSLKISGNGLDTVLRMGVYIQTITKIALKPGQYRISIVDIDHTTLSIEKIEIYSQLSAIITAKLGYKNDLRWGSINSKRKLTQLEIDKIIDDCSNRMETELVKNKTCIISWQI